MFLFFSRISSRLFSLTWTTWEFFLRWMRLRLRRSRHFYSSSKPKTFRPNRKLPRKNCQVSTICGFVIFLRHFYASSVGIVVALWYTYASQAKLFLYDFVLFLCSSKLLSAHFSLLHEDNTTAPFQEKLHKTFPKSKPSNGKKKFLLHNSDFCSWLHRASHTWILHDQIFLSDPPKCHIWFTYTPGDLCFLQAVECSSVHTMANYSRVLQNSDDTCTYTTMFDHLRFVIISYCLQTHN